MKKISSIGSLLKKIYRNYSNEILIGLQQRGFTDLRASFLEVMLFICEHERPSIKDIGAGCNLKKQTMTSHLSEINEKDRREQMVILTEYGEKFKLSLFECINELEKKYIGIIGEVEIDRIYHQLKFFYLRIFEDQHQEFEN